MAPEVLDPETYGYTKKSRKKLPSKSTDIYALGMTILEVCTSSPLPLFLSHNLILPLQVVTGRRPFEHTNPEPAVIREVLSGNRPDRPTVGFSDPLWVLLTKTWLEEHESTPPTRPSITEILRQLQDDVNTWSPTSRRPASPAPIERQASCMSSTSAQPPSGPTRTRLTRKSQRRVPSNLVGIWINSWDVPVCFGSYPHKGMRAYRNIQANMMLSLMTAENSTLSLTIYLKLSMGSHLRKNSKIILTTGMSLVGIDKHQLSCHRSLGLGRGRDKT